MVNCNFHISVSVSVYVCVFVHAQVSVRVCLFVSLSVLEGGLRMMLIVGAFLYLYPSWFCPGRVPQ